MPDLWHLPYKVSGDDSRQDSCIFFPGRIFYQKLDICIILHSARVPISSSHFVPLQSKLFEDLVVEFDSGKIVLPIASLAYRASFLNQLPVLQGLFIPINLQLPELHMR